MNTLEELNVKILGLRKEKADITAEITETQRKRSEKGANTFALDQEKAELIADAGDVDREITIATAQVKCLLQCIAERNTKVDAIRMLVAASLSSGSTPDIALRRAAQVEEKIQALVPLPVLPDIENYDEN